MAPPGRVVVQHRRQAARVRSDEAAGWAGRRCVARAAAGRLGLLEPGLLPGGCKGRRRRRDDVCAEHGAVVGRHVVHAQPDRARPRAGGGLPRRRLRDDEQQLLGGGERGRDGLFGTGVSVEFDHRSFGTQIDDSIMQKNLSARVLILDKKYLFSVNSKVLDGRIFLTGKVDDPEEKLKLTKMAWEIQGVRSVRNDIKIKEDFNFKQSAKDLLITSQLRTALILNRNIKASNYQIDTYKKKIYIYGISITSDEKEEVINEAKQILDVKNIIASILLVENLRIQKN